MNHSERLLLLFAGFFFGSIFGALAAREFLTPPMAPAGVAIDPAAQNGTMQRGNEPNAAVSLDEAPSGSTPAPAGGGMAMMLEVKKKLEEYRKTPEKFESQFGLGQLYMQKGDFTTAAQWLEKAYKQQPRNLDVLMDLGICKLRGGDTAGAEKLFREALAVKADTPEALYALASVAWGAHHDAKGALQWLDKLDKVAPNFDGTRELRDLIAAGGHPAGPAATSAPSAPA